MAEPATNTDTQQDTMHVNKNTVSLGMNGDPALQAALDDVSKSKDGTVEVSGALRQRIMALRNQATELANRGIPIDTSLIENLSNTDRVNNNELMAVDGVERDVAGGEAQAFREDLDKLAKALAAAGVSTEQTSSILGFIIGGAQAAQSQNQGQSQSADPSNTQDVGNIINTTPAASSLGLGEATTFTALAGLSRITGKLGQEDGKKIEDAMAKSAFSKLPFMESYITVAAGHDAAFNGQSLSANAPRRERSEGTGRSAPIA